MALASRMAKELKKLEKQPPPGITVLPVNNSIKELDVQLQGPSDTPFEAGLFKLRVTVPDRYGLVASTACMLTTLQCLMPSARLTSSCTERHWTDFALAACAQFVQCTLK